jgi:hypothetical protein
MTCSQRPSSAVPSSTRSAPLRRASCRFAKHCSASSAETSWHSSRRRSFASSHSNSGRKPLRASPRRAPTASASSAPARDRCCLDAAPCHECSISLGYTGRRAKTPVASPASRATRGVTARRSSQPAGPPRPGQPHPWLGGHGLLPRSGGPKIDKIPPPILSACNLARSRCLPSGPVANAPWSSKLRVSSPSRAESQRGGTGLSLPSRKGRSATSVPDLRSRLSSPTPRALPCPADSRCRR